LAPRLMANEPAIGQRSMRTAREGELMIGASALPGLRRLRYKRPGAEQELQ
jgi:hypothetical protein